MSQRIGLDVGRVEVRPLLAQDIPLLRAQWNPRISEADISGVIQDYPDRSFWVPRTGEFILVQPWRRRDDLPHIHTLWSFDHDEALLAAAANAAQASGAACLVMLETGERRKPGFYHRFGFERVEVIRTYEHSEPHVLSRSHDATDVQFVRIDRTDLETLRAVTAIDHAAFPWFWWNSAEEFQGYMAFPGVELWAGLRDGRVITYFGFTQYRQWAHLDRIAVAPDHQHKGLGRVTLAVAAHRMMREGAARIGLSTQSSNRVSRRMYESMGFRHTRQSDYDVYGMVFDAERVYRPA